MKRQPFPFGFTLIELLIVVAIIAILAAIAVPNLLEAQVRSKVARVLNDERTLATGCEAYTVDFKRYPTRDVANPNQSPIYVWKKITTPIAYLTSAPQDPFYNAALVETLLLNHPTMPLSAHKLYYYWNLPEMIPWGWHGYTGMQNDASNGLWMNRHGVIYIIASWGPDRSHYSSGGGWLLYDPTNGTVSGGNIFRTGPFTFPNFPYTPQHPN